MLIWMSLQKTDLILRNIQKSYDQNYKIYKKALYYCFVKVISKFWKICLKTNYEQNSLFKKFFVFYFKWLQPKISSIEPKLTSPDNWQSWLLARRLTNHNPTFGKFFLTSPLSSTASLAALPKTNLKVFT